MIKPIKIENAEVVQLNGGAGYYIQIGDEIFAVEGCRKDGHPGTLRWRVIPDAATAGEQEVIEYFAAKRPVQTHADCR